MRDADPTAILAHVTEAQNRLARELRCHPLGIAEVLVHHVENRAFVAHRTPPKDGAGRGGSQPLRRNSWSAASAPVCPSRAASVMQAMAPSNRPPAPSTSPRP